MGTNDLQRNGSGCYDPTAYKAIKNVDNQNMKESERFFNLLNTLFYITELAGFKIEGRITLRDTKTGRVWR